MGRTPTINPETGQKLIEAYARLGTQRAAAEEVGVPWGAASRYFARLSKAAASTVVTQQQIVERVATSIFETRQVLEQNYQRTNALVQQLEGSIQNHGTGALESLSPQQINAYVGAIRAVNDQVEKAAKLLELFTRAEEIQKFQRAVIEAVGEADEPTRRRVIAKLREYRATFYTGGA